MGPQHHAGAGQHPGRGGLPRFILQHRFLPHYSAHPTRAQALCNLRFGTVCHKWGWEGPPLDRFLPKPLEAFFPNLLSLETDWKEVRLDRPAGWLSGLQHLRNLEVGTGDAPDGMVRLPPALTRAYLNFGEGDLQLDLSSAPGLRICVVDGDLEVVRLLGQGPLPQLATLAVRAHWELELDFRRTPALQTLDLDSCLVYVQDSGSIDAGALAGLASLSLRAYNDHVISSQTARLLARLIQSAALKELRLDLIMLRALPLTVRRPCLQVSTASFQLFAIALVLRRRACSCSLSNPCWPARVAFLCLSNAGLCTRAGEAAGKHIS